MSFPASFALPAQSEGREPRQTHQEEDARISDFALFSIRIF